MHYLSLIYTTTTAPLAITIKQRRSYFLQLSAYSVASCLISFLVIHYATHILSGTTIKPHHNIMHLALILISYTHFLISKYMINVKEEASMDYKIMGNISPHNNEFINTLNYFINLKECYFNGCN